MTKKVSKAQRDRAELKDIVSGLKQIQEDCTEPCLVDVGKHLIFTNGGAKMVALEKLPVEGHGRLVTFINEYPDDQELDPEDYAIVEFCDNRVLTKIRLSDEALASLGILIVKTELKTDLIENDLQDQQKKSEASEFGLDYDGAISAGPDGWQCDDCQNWNRSSDIQCRFCTE